MYSVAYRRFTVHRLWCPRISSNSFCTETNNYTDINNCRTSTFNDS